MAPWLSGCARLLEWSANQQRGEERQIQQAIESTTTATTAGQTAEGGSTSSSTTGTTASSSPDLAVIRGDVPEKNVRAAMAELGGMERFVGKGAKVVVKPNVLTGAAPEYAVTTNPIVLGAVATLLFRGRSGRGHRARLSHAAARPAFEVSGLAKAAAEAGGTVKYLSDRDFENISIPKGRL